MRLSRPIIKWDKAGDFGIVETDIPQGDTAAEEHTTKYNYFIKFNFDHSEYATTMLVLNKNGIFMGVAQEYEKGKVLGFHILIDSAYGINIKTPDYWLEDTTELQGANEVSLNKRIGTLLLF